MGDSGPGSAGSSSSGDGGMGSPGGGSSGGDGGAGEFGGGGEGGDQRQILHSFGDFRSAISSSVDSWGIDEADINSFGYDPYTPLDQLLRRFDETVVRDYYTRNYLTDVAQEGANTGKGMWEPTQALIQGTQTQNFLTKNAGGQSLESYLDRLRTTAEQTKETMQTRQSTQDTTILTRHPRSLT